MFRADNRPAFSYTVCVSVLARTQHVSAGLRHTSQTLLTVIGGTFRCFQKVRFVVFDELFFDYKFRIVAFDQISSSTSCRLIKNPFFVQIQKVN